MGNALIVMTVPEEMVGMSQLYVWDQAAKEPTPVPVAPRKRAWVRGGERARVLREHPEAFVLVPVSPTAVWTPPDEPWREEGRDWHRDPEARLQHREKMRRSLESYLNTNLRGVDQMVRTGWMIVERARVQVTEFETVPELKFNRRKGKGPQVPTVAGGDYEKMYARAKAKERAEEAPALAENVELCRLIEERRQNRGRRFTSDEVGRQFGIPGRTQKETARVLTAHEDRVEKNLTEELQRLRARPVAKTAALRAERKAEIARAVKVLRVGKTARRLLGLPPKKKRVRP